ncbi:N-acetylmuramoyl-L-alanine amidase [Streptomyces sp. AC555_RSS877]|uniref:N-acetylmuramoyl-L-alanine amidase n=1 Tax=Streptomyces sp. AC555_RSS877 TaxID=2823688 RepID=UPI0020B63944|nr:N-acetylmuramoyl-L-alanine amidase [Streptomyces sp. AC555_RSS877]
MKLVTRSQWGARAYRTPNGATPYSRPRRGVKLHYLGTAYSDRAHDKCDDYVRQIQAQHMDGNGWSDIGYSFVVCTHGYVYEGRGLKRRNSANGSTTLNDQDYAVLLMVGSSGLTKPTTAQLDGARDAIDYCRAEGPAGAWIGGHRDGYPTACPGDVVYAWVKAGAPRPAATPPKTATPQETAVTEAEMDRIADKVVDRLLAADKFNAPTDAADYSDDPKNPGHYWSGRTVFRDLVTRVRRIDKAVAELAAKKES